MIPVRALLPCGLALAALLTSCSMDIVPVSKTRLNSIRLAEKPVLRGPDAPGAFKRSWSFATGPKGFLLDPTEIEIAEGEARLKAPGPQEKDRARQAQIVTKYGPPYFALDSFQATARTAGEGKIVFQLSPDSSRWFFHDGKSWAPAGPSAERANTVDEINRHIGKFHLEAGAGSLHVKVFLVAPTGKEKLALSSIDVQGIAPRTDGWD